MRIVRVAFYSLLAILFVFLAYGFAMTWFVGALLFGLIFIALSIASVIEAINAGLKRPD